MTNKKPLAPIDEIEDYLQSQYVFENGLNGKPAHMDSYMTIIDIKKLTNALKTSPFTKDDMMNASAHWEKQAYLSPILKLLAIYVNRYYDKIN